MFKVEIGVVTYPPRAEQAEQLIKTIGGEVNLFNDKDCKGIRFSHFNALKMMLATGGDWLCLLQDDVIPCDNFREKLQARVEMAEGRKFGFFQLFNFHTPSDEQWEDGWETYPGSNFMCDQGNVFRFDYLRKFLLYFEDNYYAPWATDRTCDSMVAKWLSSNKMKSICAIPNLLDHDLEVKSTKNTPNKIGNTIRGSKSFSFGAK